MNEYFKKMLRGIGRNFLYFTRAVIRRMPYGVYRIFAKGLILFGKLVMFNKRKLALQNLKFAFGREKSKDEIRCIAKAYFKNFGRGMVDNIYFADRPELLDQNICIEGQEHLDRALEQGNGAILTGGHFGDFILMYFKLVRAGYKVNVIMRRVRDESFEKFLSEFRQNRGLNAIYDLPAKKCVVQCIKALRNNEVLVILLDQNYGSASRVFVDFFGRKAATATGPMVFSLRTKAPILPIFCLQGDGPMKHKVIVEPPMVIDPGDDPDDQIYRGVAKITKIIEGYIRQYPDQWGGWIHKRWKSKPLAEQQIIDRLTQKSPKKSRQEQTAKSVNNP